MRLIETAVYNVKDLDSGYGSVLSLCREGDVYVTRVTVEVAEAEADNYLFHDEHGVVTHTAVFDPNMVTHELSLVELG